MTGCRVQTPAIVCEITNWREQSMKVTKSKRITDVLYILRQPPQGPVYGRKIKTIWKTVSMDAYFRTVISQSG